MEEGFEKAKKQMVFLYPSIALGELNLFKIVVGENLVEVAEEKGDVEEAVSPFKNN